MILCLTLLCAACQGKPTHHSDAEQLRQEIRSFLEERGSFTEADPDFIESNFEFDPPIVSGTVYFEEQSDTEIGFFKVADPKDLSAAERSVKSYLSREAESAASISELYPSEAADKRRQRFENATVHTIGEVIVYYVMEKEDALLLEGRLS